MSRISHSVPNPQEGCITHMLKGVVESAAMTYEQTEARLAHLYKRFICTAILITLTFGTFWGVSILTKAATTRSFGAPEPSQIQAHAHAQVFGWIGLLIMGVAYYAYPKFKGAALRCLRRAELSYWLMTSGIVLRAICQPFAENSLAGAAVAFSGAIEVAAALLFASAIYQVFRSSSKPLHTSDLFIFSSIAWLVIALSINAFSMFQIARTGDPVIAELWNLRRMNVEVFGFIISMILGVGSRIFPKLLGLREVRIEVGALAAIVYASGVALKAFGAVPAVGSLLIFGAAALYLAELNVFAKPSKSDKLESGDHLRTWVRVAFFWLVASAAMLLSGDAYELGTGLAAPHAWVGAYRHAVTVGFITTLAVGVALKTAPLFHGTTLYSRRLVAITFWLLVIGNLARVVFQVFTLTKSPVAYAVAGMSGYLELTALILFGWNIFRTFAKPVEQDTKWPEKTMAATSPSRAA